MGLKYLRYIYYSKLIHYIDYDDYKSELIIKYQNGDIIIYKNVEIEHYYKLFSCSSIEQYLEENIKGKYNSYTDII